MTNSEKNDSRNDLTELYLCRKSKIADKSSEKDWSRTLGKIIGMLTHC